MSETKRKWYEIDSATLHIIAMLFVLSDHAWATLFPSQRWMTAIGRIAFPIFAFTTAEGYFHTHDFKKYLQRMLIFALLTEIPFNLMIGGQLIVPYHQNVLWTFIIALCGMKIMDKIRARKKLWLSIIGCAFTMIVCALLGFAGFVDYFGTGVLMVFVFYFFHERKWWSYLGQFVLMYWLNVELLGGYCFNVNLFGAKVEIVEQGLALIALIPIWLYKGRQGLHTKAFRYACYAFYPVHMLILVLIGYLMSI